MDCSHAIDPEVLTTLLGLEGEGVGSWLGDADVEFLDAVLAHVGDVHEGADCGGVAAVRLDVGAHHAHTEGVRRGGGGHLPLDGAHPQLSPDAVDIILRKQNLASSEVVALYIS